MSQGSVSSGSQALRPRDVCQQLGIQPYVLKFWEGEFPQLGRRLGAKRLYGAEELRILAEIQRLVEQERLNLGQAREELARAFPSGEEPAAPAAPAPVAAAESRSESLVTEAREKIRHLSEQVASLEAELSETRSEIDGLRHRHQQLAESLAEVRKQRDALTERAAGLEANVAGQQARCRQLEEDLEQARADRAQLEARLASVQQAGATERLRMAEQLRLAREEIGALGQALDEVSQALGPDSRQ